MLEKYFGSDLKIKILRELYNNGQMRFSEIRTNLNSGSGSLQKALESLVEEAIIIRKEEGPKKLYFELNEDHIDFLKEIFKLEKIYMNRLNKEDILKDFFQI